MSRRRPRSVSPDEVRITRTADTAIIEHADETTWTTNLTLGARITTMTDAMILAEYNHVLAAQADAIDNYDNVCVEVPVGRPQIKWEERCGQWVPRGGIVRGVIHSGARVDDEPNVTVTIDEHELTLTEFGRMLEVYAGWGMRISFVPAEYLHEEPDVDVREPEE